MEGPTLAVVVVPLRKAEQSDARSAGRRASGVNILRSLGALEFHRLRSETTECRLTTSRNSDVRVGLQPGERTLDRPIDAKDWFVRRIDGRIDTSSQNRTAAPSCAFGVKANSPVLSSKLDQPSGTLTVNWPPKKWRVV